MNPLSVGQLGQLHEVASGAQGVVYELPEFRMNGVPAMVYKAYKPDARKKIDVAALARMPEFAESLSPSDRVRLLSWAAWPWRLVEDGPGSVSGFLMPAIPPAFKTYMRKTGGSGWVTAGLQLLLEPAARLAKRGIVLTERQRYELIAETAKALAFLHSHDISVGDLSPRNLLFALNPPGVFFVDCDSMQIRGRSAMGTQVETPDWNVRTKSNPNEDLGTPASDSYKLGLLALRLLVGDQSTRDDTTLPAQTPGQIRQLVHDALSTNPAERPTPADWLDALASLTGSTPDIRKGPKGPKRRRALIVGAVAIAAIAGITIVAPDLDQSTKTGGNDTSNGGAPSYGGAPSNGGAQSAGSDEDQIKALVRTWDNDFNNQDLAGMKSLMCSGSASQLPRKLFPRHDIKGTLSSSVSNINVTGNVATATVISNWSGGSHERWDNSYGKQNGAWKICHTLSY